MKNNLDFLMTSRKVTVTQLAKGIKTSRSTVYRILDGGTPSANVMMKIAAFFDKDVKDIFFAPNVQHVVHKTA